MGAKSSRPWWILASVLSVAALAGGYFFFQDQVVNSRLRPLLEKKLSDALRSPATIELVQADIRGGVVLKNVSLLIPGPTVNCRLLVDRVAIRLDLVNLLWRHQKIEDSLESISFFQPKMFLSRSAPVSIASSAGPITSAASSVSMVSAPQALASVPLLPFKKVFVRGGEVFYQADSEKEGRAIAQEINLQAFSDGSSHWGIWLDAKPPELKSPGSLLLNGSLNLSDLKAVGKIQLQDWTLKSLGSLVRGFTGWEPLGGTANVEVPFAFRFGGNDWFDIRGHFQDASVKAPGANGIIFSGINGRAVIRPTELTLSQPIQFQVGETPFQASGLIPFDGRPVSVTTSTDTLYLATLFHDVLNLQDLKVEGVGRATLTVSGDLLNPTIQGEAELGASRVGDWELDSLFLKADYADHLFQLSQITGKLYDGSLSANGMISLAAGSDEPVSLRASLQNIQTQKVAAILGISGMEGLANSDVELGGTLQEPTLSATTSMDLVRTLRGALYHYSVRNLIQLKSQKLQLSFTLNDKNRLEMELEEKPDFWELGKFSLNLGKKNNRFQAKGQWPKTMDKPVQLEIHGQDIALQDLFFFKDQFPDVAGNVNLDAVYSGTRADPEISIQAQSDSVTVGSDSDPMTMSLDWKSDNLSFKELKFGEKLSVEGDLGLSPEKPMDLKVQAQKIPIGLLAEVTDWNNPPQPFSGFVKGNFHFAGTRKNPIVEGSGQVENLQAGDWSADLVDALITLDNGKLQIQKLILTQGKNDLSISGSWDTEVQPANMTLAFSARDFRLGAGPYLSGDFKWEGQTGDPWWNCNGRLSSPLVSLRYAKNNINHFNDFSMVASCQDFKVKGTGYLGKAIVGTALFDFSTATPELEASVKISPVLLSEAPDLTQFLPEGLKVSGLISGEVKLPMGTINTLPLEGHFVVVDGKIQDYDFNKLVLDFSGNRNEISPSLSLERDAATYTLSGSLESPIAFWDNGSQINLNGPFENEKLVNILSLLKVDTEDHKVDGQVNGNLSITGTVGQPSLNFELQGTDLRFDNNIVPSADLRFSAAQGQVKLGTSHLSLVKGQINIDRGTLGFDSQDSSLLNLDLEGSTDNLPIAIFNMTNHIHLAGNLALSEKPNRPTFDGTLSIIDSGNSTPQTQASNAPPFVLGISVNQKKILFKPLNNSNVQLVGALDLSEPQKIIFDHLHLVNSSESFLLDGYLDFNGQCQLASDAENIPIEQIGKWFFPDFPLVGTGNYHLLLQGTLEDPIFNTSFSISDGQFKNMKFDLLSGDLKSQGHTLLLGSAEVPLTISRKGLYSFGIHGEIPFTLSPAGFAGIRNQEISLDAKMDQGDFGLIMLTGVATKASGLMDFSAHIGGTLDDPILNMDVDIQKGNLVPENFAHSLDDINGRIKVRDNHVAVDDLNFQVGQGRVFIWTPPLSESKVVLENFIPQYLDFNIRTVGDHGLYVNIPAIMRSSDWGDIQFYGDTKDDPLRIDGPITEPHIHGTALLQDGHYKFPPDPTAKNASGKTVSYSALGNVDFDLNMIAGNNCWYSNDFAGQFIELKVDPGDVITIQGKDSDKTPDTPGIKASGTAGSKQGFLRYLNREFDLQEAHIFIPNGKLPTMTGSATETIKNAQIETAGGIVQSDLTITIYFNGTFGNVDFTLDSNPRLTALNDPQAEQKVILSYILFGRDMTGYSREDLAQAYQQNTGSAFTQGAYAAADLWLSNQLTAFLRPFGQVLGGIDVNVQQNGLQNVIPGGTNTNTTNSGTGQVPEAGGNTIPAGVSSVFKLGFQKYLDSKLSVQTNVGMLRDQSTNTADLQTQFGLGYDINKNLSVNAMTGQNDYGQYENTASLSFHTFLPNVMSANKDDKVPPKFIRCDVYLLGPGKIRVSWETDKVTQGEVRVFNEDNEVVKDMAEPAKFDYDHDLIVDGLEANAQYKVQVFVKDLNQNQSVSDSKDVATPPG